MPWIVLTIDFYQVQSLVIWYEHAMRASQIDRVRELPLFREMTVANFGILAKAALLPYCSSDFALDNSLASVPSGRCGTFLNFIFG